jgi:hypothetical protein
MQDIVSYMLFSQIISLQRERNAFLRLFDGQYTMCDYGLFFRIFVERTVLHLSSLFLTHSSWFLIALCPNPSQILVTFGERLPPYLEVVNDYQARRFFWNRTNAFRCFFSNLRFPVHIGPGKGVVNMRNIWPGWVTMFWTVGVYLLTWRGLSITRSWDCESVVFFVRHCRHSSHHRQAEKKKVWSMRPPLLWCTCVRLLFLTLDHSISHNTRFHSAIV